MRAVLPVIALGILAACAPEVPDSGAGIGFGSEADAVRAREMELAGAPATFERLAPATAISSESTAPAAPLPLPAAAQPTLMPANSTVARSSGSSADIAAETAAALAAASSNSGQVPLQANPSNPVPGSASNSGISDENDFAAVSGRQSIQSDAARIEQNRQSYQVVTPTVLPSRSSESQPNIVSYALSTSNPVGTRVHSRSGFNQAAKAERNCRTYVSPDQAQIDFLAKGGPARDRMGLDPDGDGYACSWDPSRFRKVVKN